MSTEKRAKEKYLLGTAVKITVIFSIIPDTAKITIDNPSETEQVSLVAMTPEASKVYSYVYQSSSTGTEGDYVITITATKDVYTSVVQDYVTLLEQE